MEQADYRELEKEKEKLNRLADEALKNGIALTKDKTFMVQNRKVDTLIARLLREKKRHRKNQQER